MILRNDEIMIFFLEMRRIIRAHSPNQDKQHTRFNLAYSIIVQFNLRNTIIIIIVDQNFQLHFTDADCADIIGDAAHEFV